jgi:hypothetical protein
MPSDGTFDLNSDGPKRGGGGGAERGGKRDARGGRPGGHESGLPQKSFKRQAKDAK